MELDRTPAALEAAARRYQRAVAASRTRDADRIASDIVSALEPLLAKFTAQYGLPGIDQGDIVQAGRLAVLRALDAYDPNAAGAALFWTFAHRGAECAIRNYVARDSGTGAICQPAQLGVNRRKVARIQTAAEAQGEGELSPGELAARTNLTLSAVRAVLASAPTLSAAPIRFDDATRADRRAPGTISPDVIADPRDAVAEFDLHHDLAHFLSRLPDTYRTVLVARFVEQQSLDKIAAARNLTREGVRQQIARGLARIRILMDADGYTQ